MAKSKEGVIACSCAQAAAGRDVFRPWGTHRNKWELLVRGRSTKCYLENSSWEIHLDGFVRVLTLVKQKSRYFPPHTSHPSRHQPCPAAWGKHGVLHHTNAICFPHAESAVCRGFWWLLSTALLEAATSPLVRKHQAAQESVRAAREQKVHKNSAGKHTKFKVVLHSEATNPQWKASELDPSPNQIYVAILQWCSSLASVSHD